MEFGIHFRNLDLGLGFGRYFQNMGFGIGIWFFYANAGKSRESRKIPEDKITIFLFLAFSSIS